MPGTEEAPNEERVWVLTSSDLILILLLRVVVVYILPKRLLRSAHQAHRD